MNRQERHHIKQDDLVSGIEHVTRYVRAHQQEVKLTVAAVAVGGLAVLGFTTWRHSRNSEAEQALSAALTTFHAPIAGENPGQTPPAGVQFATAAEKYGKAVGEFDGVERRYGSLPAGKRAGYYAALCRLELGQGPEAEKALSALAASGSRSSLEPALARLALADLYRRTGKLDQAVSSYQLLADDASSAVPRDYVLMTLSSTLEEAHKLPEATASYRRLADEFPSSPYAPEARQRASYLEGGAQG